MERRAFTFLELLLAATLFIVLTGLTLGAWLMLNRTTRTQLTRIEARQQVRTAIAVVKAELQSSAVVYDSYVGNFCGTHYNVVGPNGAGGNDLIYAIPEGAINPTWKICGLRLVNRGPNDPNPNTQDLVEQEAEAGPATDNDPINLGTSLATLTASKERSFSLNVIPGSGKFVLHCNTPLTGLPRTYCLAGLPVSVFMHLDFKVKPADLAASANYTMTETFETEAFLRNQPPAIPP